MRRAIFFLSLVSIFLAVPIRATQESAPGELSPPKTVEITGTVQSFTSNILDIKPADAPSVWVTIPNDLRVDRSALKDGAKVSAKAYWAYTCFVASDVTLRK